MSANEPKPTAIVRRAKPQIVLGHGGFEFTLDAALRFADELIAAEMVPKGLKKNRGAIVALMQAGREIGLPPMFALGNMTFINGRVGIMGDAAKALIRARKMLKPGTDFAEVYIGEEFTPEWTCTVTAWRVDAPEPVSRSFSLAEAVEANLARMDGKKVLAKDKDGWNSRGPWAAYTERMLMYRALGFLCRDEFSDVLGGCVLLEELRDYPPERRRGEPPAGDDPLLNPEELTVEEMTAREQIGAILGEFYEGNLEAMKKAFQIVTGKRFFPDSEPGSEFYSSVKQLTNAQADELLAELRSGTIALPAVEVMFPASEPPFEYEEEGPEV